MRLRKCNDAYWSLVNALGVNQDPKILFENFRVHLVSKTIVEPDDTYVVYTTRKVDSRPYKPTKRACSSLEESKRRIVFCEEKRKRLAEIEKGKKLSKYLDPSSVL